MHLLALFGLFTDRNDSIWLYPFKYFNLWNPYPFTYLTPEKPLSGRAFPLQAIIKSTNFHNKGFALSLVLKVRFFGTRKWSIAFQGLRDNLKSRKLVAKGGNCVSHELLIACRFPLFGLATTRSKLLKTLSYLSLNGLSIFLCSPMATPCQSC